MLIAQRRTLAGNMASLQVRTDHRTTPSDRGREGTPSTPRDRGHEGPPHRTAAPCHDAAATRRTTAPLALKEVRGTKTRAANRGEHTYKHQPYVDRNASTTAGPAPSPARHVPPGAVARGSTSLGNRRRTTAEEPRKTSRPGTQRRGLGQDRQGHRRQRVTATGPMCVLRCGEQEYSHHCDPMVLGSTRTSTSRLEGTRLSTRARARARTAHSR